MLTSIFRYLRHRFGIGFKEDRHFSTVKFNVKRAEKELSVLGFFLFGFENKEYKIEGIYVLERVSLKTTHNEVSTVTRLLNYGQSSEKGSSFKLYQRKCRCYRVLFMFSITSQKVKKEVTQFSTSNPILKSRKRDQQHG